MAYTTWWLLLSQSCNVLFNSVVKVPAFTRFAVVYWKPCMAPHLLWRRCFCDGIMISGAIQIVSLSYSKITPLSYAYSAQKLDSLARVSALLPVLTYIFLQYCSGLYSRHIHVLPHPQYICKLTHNQRQYCDVNCTFDVNFPHFMA